MRIRSIKPEFWRSDDVNDMRLEDRLLFIGLWSYVDDNGVGIDRHADICADLFAHDLSVSPHDTLMRVQNGLNRLSALEVIQRYEVGGKRYLEITNWSKHQKINRPSPGRYPRSDDEGAEIHELLTEDSLPGAVEQGSSGTGEQLKTSSKRGGRRSYPPEFEEFWATYPKKADKPVAATAWSKARERASHEEILEGAAQYRDDPNRDEGYTKNASTWLNADAWWNDALPPRSGRPSRAQEKESNNLRILTAFASGDYQQEIS